MIARFPHPPTPDAFEERCLAAFHGEASIMPGPLTHVEVCRLGGGQVALLLDDEPRTRAFFVIATLAGAPAALVEVTDLGEDLGERVVERKDALPEAFGLPASAWSPADLERLAAPFQAAN